MKICVWYETTEKPYGGANSFLKGLSKQLSEMGHEVISRPNQSADVILINSWTCGVGKRLTHGMAARLKRYGNLSYFHIFYQYLKSFLGEGRGKRQPIIHRLDGIAALYGRHDDSDEAQIKINRFSDYTIFQSVFCKKSFSNLGVSHQNSMVIHNGADGSLYYPDRTMKRLIGNLKVLAVSWSNNPNKGFSTLEGIASLSNVDLTFIGNWCDSIPQGNVRVLGPRKGSEIAEMMRQSDILIHAAENDTCPNVVLEGLASGLPVLYRDSGGTAELAKEYGVPIFADIEKSISEIIENYKCLREKILDNLYLFSVEYSAKKYLNVFEELRKQNL